MANRTEDAALSTAYIYGRNFAEYLNKTPAEAQNWDRLEERDDIPVEDYRALSDKYGDVTVDMERVERAYRSGFNDAFDTSHLRSYDD